MFLSVLWVLLIFTLGYGILQSFIVPILVSDALYHHDSLGNEPCLSQISFVYAYVVSIPIRYRDVRVFGFNIFFLMSRLGVVVVGVLVWIVRVFGAFGGHFI